MTALFPAFIFCIRKKWQLEPAATRAMVPERPPAVEEWRKSHSGNRFLPMGAAAVWFPVSAPQMWISWTHSPASLLLLFKFGDVVNIYQTVSWIALAHWWHIGLLESVRSHGKETSIHSDLTTARPVTWPHHVTGSRAAEEPCSLGFSIGVLCLDPPQAAQLLPVSHLTH